MPLFLQQQQNIDQKIKKSCKTFCNSSPTPHFTFLTSSRNCTHAVQGSTGLSDNWTAILSLYSIISLLHSPESGETQIELLGTCLQAMATTYLDFLKFIYLFLANTGQALKSLNQKDQFLVLMKSKVELLLI